MKRRIQTSSNDAAVKRAIGTGFGKQTPDADGAAAWPKKKTGAYPKISSRCASVGAAFLWRVRHPLVRRPVSGPNALMVGGFPRCSLRCVASVPNPQLVQSPDDLRLPDPFGLAPSLFGLSPIIDPEINCLFLRKANWSPRPSSGFRAVLRVIADWSLVRPSAFR